MYSTGIHKSAHGACSKSKFLCGSLPVVHSMGLRIHHCNNLSFWKFVYTQRLEYLVWYVRYIRLWYYYYNYYYLRCHIKAAILSYLRCDIMVLRSYSRYYIVSAIYWDVLAISIHVAAILSYLRCHIMVLRSYSRCYIVSAIYWDVLAISIHVAAILSYLRCFITCHF